MSASTILSAIAPVVGAAPSPSATAGEDVSAEFAAMVTDAGDVAEAGAAPAAASAPVKAAPAKTSHTPLIADVVDASADAADLAPTPAPAAETEASPPSPAPAPAPVEAEAADDTADAETSPPVVEQAAIPVAAAPARAQPTLVPAPAPAAVATQQPSGEVPPAPASGPADTPEPAAPATLAEAMPATDTADAPPPSGPQPTAAPLKDEPVRMASSTRETKAQQTSAEPSSATTQDAAKAAPSAGSASTPAAPAQTPAAPTVTRADAAPLKPLEAAVPTVSAETPATTTATQDTPAAPAEVAASTLSRATIETTVQIAARIARQLEGKQTRFDMVLTPEDLGRVEVTLDIDSEGRLAARLAFDNPAAAADLRGRADELRRQLTDAGFHLAGDSLEFSERDPNAFSGGAFDRGQNRAFSFAGGKRVGDQADLAVAKPAAWINLSLTPDRVDMRV